MKTETKVLITLGIAWLLAEAVVRPLENRLSADIRHIRSFETFAARLEAAQSDGRLGVIVVGNSLARAGIHQETLVEILEEQGWPDPLILYLAPDASGVNEWIAAWRRHLLYRGARPDLVILVTGPQHLLDQPVRSPEKLAAFLAPFSDWSDILGDWLQTDNERGRFLLAGISQVFANRARFRPLLFYHLIPDYAEAAEEIRREVGTGERFESGYGTDRLQELLEDIVTVSARVDLLPVPMPEPYYLPPEVLEQAEDKGVNVFGEAAAMPWPRDAFPDGYHLGESAAERFTFAWGEALRLSEASLR